jgi:hypothetical protein
MRKIPPIANQLGSPAYRWLFVFNGLALILTLVVAYISQNFLPLATTIAVVNLMIIVIQASVTAYWKRTWPIQRRADDPEL